MTRGELRARVRYFIDEPVQQNFTDADINIALNIAQDQVALEINQASEDYFINPIPTVINLVPGTETYPLSDDVLVVKRVEDGQTGLDILPLDINEKVAPGTGLPGLVSAVPGNWYLIGNSIGFTPPPSQTNTIRYWYVPALPLMAQDTDVSQIPRPYHDMIAVRAAIDSFIKDEADVANLRNLWGEYIDRLKRTITNRQAMAPKHVRRTTKLDGWPAVGPF